MSTTTTCVQHSLYMDPASRVGRSELTGHWLVDPDSPMTRQGYRHYESALAEAERRSARDLRSLANSYEASARRRDPEDD